MKAVDWQRAAAPQLADFEKMAAVAWERLPDAFGTGRRSLIASKISRPTKC
jgi:predicted Zn-dependent protease with MMP-like domain